MRFAEKFLNEMFSSRQIFWGAFTQDQWRHSYFDNVVCAILKCARCISGVRSSILLISRGFYQEAGAVFRMVHEFWQEITFILSANGRKYWKFMRDFYVEEFSDFSNISETQVKRARIASKDVQRSLERILRKEGDRTAYDDGSSRIFSAYSGYVHGAYPHIMEMVRGQPAQISCGFKVIPQRERALWRDCISYSYRTLGAAELISFIMDNHRANWALNQMRVNFERTFPDVVSPVTKA